MPCPPLPSFLIGLKSLALRTRPSADVHESVSVKEEGACLVKEGTSAERSDEAFTASNLEDNNGDTGE